MKIIIEDECRFSIAYNLLVEFMRLAKNNRITPILPDDIKISLDDDFNEVLKCSKYKLFEANGAIVCKVGNKKRLTPTKHHKSMEELVDALYGV